MDPLPRPTSCPSDQPLDLSGIVREKLERGELPKIDEVRLILNLGAITACVACGTPITGLECIAEFHDGRQFRFHGACVEVWRSERGTGADRGRLVIPHPDWEGNNPDVTCAACELRIQPFDDRYMVRDASFHPSCYERMQEGDWTSPPPSEPGPASN